MTESAVPVTRRLLLLRHAKSSWDHPELADDERPLTPRGRRAVADLRRHLAAEAVAPDLVLCSTARRAVETWEGVAGGLPEGTAVERDAGLYGAGAAALLRRLRALPDSVGSVLVIGHNPGLEELATGLAGSGDAPAQRRLQAKFPTGALATLDLPVPWAAAAWGCARLVAFVVPRELSASAD